MNIETIREFVLLSKYLNFTTTAKQCFISQSALSKHMNALESELGIELLVRSRGGSVGLTQAGREFAEEAEKIMFMYNGLMTRMAERRRQSVASLRVSYLDYSSHSFLIDAIEEFSRCCPETLVSLESMGGTTAAEALMHNAVDMCITLSFDDINTEWYDQFEIYDDYYVLAVREDHPFAHLSEITTDQLSEEGLIVAIPDRDKLRTEWSYLYNELHNAIPSLEIHDCIQDVNDYTIFPLIEGTPSIVPKHCTRQLDTRLRFIPITQPYLHCSVSMIWKRENEDHTVRAFVRAVREVTNKLSTEVLRGIVDRDSR